MDSSPELLNRKEPEIKDQALKEVVGLPNLMGGMLQAGQGSQSQGEGQHSRMVYEPRKLTQEVTGEKEEYFVEFPPKDSEQESKATHKMQVNEERLLVAMMGRALQLKRPRIMYTEQKKKENVEAQNKKKKWL